MIKLGPVLNEDLPKLFDWVNDIDMMRLAGTYTPVHEVNHLEWFKTLSQNPSSKVFAVRDEDQNLVGVCKLYNISWVHRNGEIAIRIGKDYQGKGYGVKTIKQLIDISFTDFNLHRLYAYIHEDNLASINAFKSAGMEFESKMKDAVYVGGKYKNLIVMSIINNK